MTKAKAGDWRRHGKSKRKQLLDQDELGGSMKFSLSKSCSIAKYFEVADRVLDDFCTMYEAQNNIEEVYVRGNRLLIFLEKALPKHPEYTSVDPKIVSMREKSRVDLKRVVQQIENVAVQIDKEQRNLYLWKKQGNNGTNLSLSSSSLESEEWENFSGWTATNERDIEWKKEYVSLDSSENTAPEDSFFEDSWFREKCETLDSDEKNFSSKDTTDISLDNSLSWTEDESFSSMQSCEDKNMLFQEDRYEISANPLTGSKTQSLSPPKLKMAKHSISRNVSNVGIENTNRSSAEDPPGEKMTFEKDAHFSFIPSKLKENDHFTDSVSKDIMRSPVDVQYKFEDFYGNIRSVPSDESDFALRRSVRINEAFNKIQIFNPKDCVKNLRSTMTII